MRQPMAQKIVYPLRKALHKYGTISLAYTHARARELMTNNCYDMYNRVSMVNQWRLYVMMVNMHRMMDYHNVYHVQLALGNQSIVPYAIHEHVTQSVNDESML